MKGARNFLGLAAPDRTSAKSSDRLGAVVRSRLAGAAVGIAVVALFALGSTSILSPAWAKPKVEKTKLGDLNCTAGQIPSFDGSVWVCSDSVPGPTGPAGATGFLAQGSGWTDQLA